MSHNYKAHQHTTMNTYKHIKLLIFIGLSAILTACDVLDVNPYDKITDEQAYKNKAGIEKGILGSYSELQNLSYYGRAYLISSDLAADNLTHPTDATQADYAEIDNNAMLAENGVADGIWSAIYSAINVANVVIDKVPAMTDMTDTEKNTALGELYFLRALNHFNLMNYFGAIPIKTKPTVGTTGLDVAKNSTDEVFTQIIADLTFAETHLGASASTKTRASKYAATALLARVYLYQKNYAMAYAKADDVIQHGGYVLLPDFASVFSGDGSAETIFEVEFNELDRTRIAEFNFPKTLNGRAEVKVDPALASAYQPTDERMAVSMATNGTYVYAKKQNDLSLGNQNVIVLRLAEMYLIKAEAEANMPTAVISNIQSALNEIRHRANLGDTDAATIAELKLAIENERRLEFAFEGHRWFDLVRTNRAVDVLQGVTNVNQTLFPIPLSELNTNSAMIQNLGYN